MCNNYLTILALFFAVALTNIPAASATAITENALNGTMETSVAGVGTLPLAKCSAETQSESLHRGLASCLDATIGQSMDSMLELLRGIGSSTTAVVNTITTGSTVVLGPLCSVSQACFPASGPTASTPVSTVPEPGTLALLGPGLIGLITMVRRRFY